MIALILDNIRSVHNVGSIFRTAETLGINQIYCLGTTPTPVDRFNRKRKDFAKVSLGAENLVKWEHVEIGSGLEEKKTGPVENLVKKLKEQKYKIIALEQSLKSIDYKDISFEKKDNLAIILGNEVSGVSNDLLKLADIVAEIPMLGKKESLNVSVAGAIFLFRLLDK